MMQAIIDHARERGLLRMRGDVLFENHKMMRLMQRMGFSCIGARGRFDIANSLAEAQRSATEPGTAAFAAAIALAATNVRSAVWRIKPTTARHRTCSRRVRLPNA